ncbi:hypothetical protein CC86DRAFT_126215 [Ophiobolus disseminans]|uniref:Uncharacterized protein n=1 Tax=Ophiobolus disseminans TaxID=1469910 RepID=A0A6A6ZHE0_9PLEO|nr:hypothetical protein CC86DRAFT_126215 [Ophiobolus disseminans]
MEGHDPAYRMSRPVYRAFASTDECYWSMSRTVEAGAWGCATGVSYRGMSFPVGSEPVVKVWPGTNEVLTVSQAMARCAMAPAFPKAFLRPAQHSGFWRLHSTGATVAGSSHCDQVCCRCPSLTKTCLSLEFFLKRRGSVVMLYRLPVQYILSCGTRILAAPGDPANLVTSEQTL